MPSRGANCGCTNYFSSTDCSHICATAQKQKLPAPASEFVLLLLTNLLENSPRVWRSLATGEAEDHSVKVGAMQAWSRARDEQLSCTQSCCLTCW